MPKKRDNKGVLTYKKIPLPQVKSDEEKRREVEKILCERTLKEFYDKCNTPEFIKENVLGYRLKTIRELYSTSRNQLSKKCNIHRSTIGHIEDGDFKTFPRFDTIKRIFDALGYDVYEFVSMPEDTIKWAAAQDKYSRITSVHIMTVVEGEYEFSDFQNTLLKSIDDATIFYTNNDSKKSLSETHKDFLKMNIFSAFELLKKML